MASDWRQQVIDRVEMLCLPKWKFGHQPRLYALTRQIGEGLAYDDDVVFAAAWLHDLGVFIGQRPEQPELLAKWDHVAYACQHIPTILIEAGFTESKIPAVLEVVKTHQPKDDPQTIEGILVRDADICEQLGAVGLMRTVPKVGSDTRFHRFQDAVYSLEAAAENLPALLRLPAAQRIGRARAEWLTNFLTQLRLEAGENLY
jgi:uncharacterized protein